jgi:sterol 3beta-glucosyltransferase
MLEDSEESWTFIGDDNDPELIKRIHDWEAMAQSQTLASRNVSTGMAMDAAAIDKGKALGTASTAA